MTVVKTKTNVIVTANHNNTRSHWNSNSGKKQTSLLSAGKWRWLRCDWFQFWNWLIEKVARAFWTNYLSKSSKTKALPDYSRHSTTTFSVISNLPKYVRTSDKKNIQIAWTIMQKKNVSYSHLVIANSRYFSLCSVRTAAAWPSRCMSTHHSILRSQLCKIDRQGS